MFAQALGLVSDVVTHTYNTSERSYSHGDVYKRFLLCVFPWVRGQRGASAKSLSDEWGGVNVVANAHGQ